MKDKPIWSQATSRPPSVLVDFCNVFSDTWTDEKIIEWIDEEKGSLASGEFVSKLKQLESSLQILVSVVDAANQYIRSFTVRPSDDADYWARDYLKGITHDLLDILLRIKNNLDFLLGETSSEPEQERERAYRGIIRYLKEGNLLVEKAFPLLKAQKSYLDDIDWHSEFDKL